MTNPPFGKKSSITVVNEEVKPTSRRWPTTAPTSGRRPRTSSSTSSGADLDDFVACYRPGQRHAGKPTWSDKTPDGRWRAYGYDELQARDKLSLDLFWLRDESLEDSANLPDPHVIAEEIAEDLRDALAQIESVLADLKARIR
jgi:hypothetical protein